MNTYTTKRLARTLLSCGLLLSAGASSCASGSSVRTRAVTDHAQGVVYHLPRTVLEVGITVTEKAVPENGPLAWTVSATVVKHTVADPDPQHTFLLERSGNALFDDEVKLGLSASGLLQTVTTDSTDKSLTVAANLVDTATGLVTFSAIGGLGALGGKVNLQGVGDPDVDLLARKI